jgi:hypothetical protein
LEFVHSSGVVVKFEVGIWYTVLYWDRGAGVANHPHARPKAELGVGVGGGSTPLPPSTGGPG